MFKIKLLILLLISITLISCETYKSNLPYEFSIKLESSGKDGLDLNNILRSNLNSIGIYSNSSQLVLRANIVHQSRLYVTQVNNTSDREEIISNLTIILQDDFKKCIVDKKTFNVKQFYVIAPSTKFLSNNRAQAEIKYRNTEILVQEWIDYLNFIDLRCIDDE